MHLVINWYFLIIPNVLASWFPFLTHFLLHSLIIYPLWSWLFKVFRDIHGKNFSWSTFHLVRTWRTAYVVQSHRSFRKLTVGKKPGSLKKCWFQLRPVMSNLTWSKQTASYPLQQVTFFWIGRQVDNIKSHIDGSCECLSLFLWLVCNSFFNKTSTRQYPDLWHKKGLKNHEAKD